MSMSLSTISEYNNSHVWDDDKLNHKSFSTDDVRSKSYPSIAVYSTDSRVHFEFGEIFSFYCMFRFFAANRV